MKDLDVVWDVVSQQQEYWFSLLISYKNMEEHYSMPRNHEEGKKNLGSWLNDQNFKKRKRTLSGKYQHILKELGVVWNVLFQQW